MCTIIQDSNQLFGAEKTSFGNKLLPCLQKWEGRRTQAGTSSLSTPVFNLSLLQLFSPCASPVIAAMSASPPSLFPQQQLLSHVCVSVRSSPLLKKKKKNSLPPSSQFYFLTRLSLSLCFQATIVSLYSDCSRSTCDLCSFGFGYLVYLTHTSKHLTKNHSGPFIPMYFIYVDDGCVHRGKM